MRTAAPTTCTGTADLVRISVSECPEVSLPRQFTPVQPVSAQEPTLSTFDVDLTQRSVRRSRLHREPAREPRSRRCQRPCRRRRHRADRNTIAPTIHAGRTHHGAETATVRCQSGRTPECAGATDVYRPDRQGHRLEGERPGARTGHRQTRPGGNDRRRAGRRLLHERREVHGGVRGLHRGRRPGKSATFAPGSAPPAAAAA